MKEESEAAHEQSRSKRHFMKAKAAAFSMAAAFGLVAVNPHLQKNEVGEVTLRTGAETACAAWGCNYHVGFVCSPTQSYTDFLQDYSWTEN